MVAPLITSLDDITTPPADLSPQALVPYGPQPARWYTKPEEPNLADVLAAAETERAAHSERIDQGLRMLRRINDPKIAACFHRLTKKVANGDIELVQLPELRNEIDMIVTTFSQMDWNVHALYRSTLRREEAAAKEDLAAYLQENAQRQYSRGLGASLKAAKIFDLVVFGCIAEFNAIDVDNDECGLRMRLVDPNTIFPVSEEERGLSQVYLKYQLPASKFIGAFGSLEGFDELAVRRAAKASGSTYDPHYVGEVVEYWDRNWVLIAWESEQVVLFEHEYAEVPFTVTPGNFGQPAHVSVTSSGRYSSSSAHAYAYTDRSEDLKRQYQPFLERILPLHDLRESMAGIVATKFRKSENPPRVMQATVLTMEDEAVRVNNSDGALTKVRAEDGMPEADDAAISFDPQVASAAFSLVQQAVATSSPSTLLAGQAPMSQASGTAINVLSRAGAERWGMIGIVAQNHEAMAMEQRLRALRNYGNLLGMDGKLYVPRRRPNTRAGEDPVHEVTVDLLKATGIRVNVEFGRFNQSELTSLSQGIGMLRSIGLLPKRDAIELIGYTDDPDRALEELDREMLDEAPEITQAKMLNNLIEDVKEAFYTGDEKSLQDAFYQLMYVADRLDIAQAERKTESSQAKAVAAMAAATIPGMNGLPQPQTGTNGGRPQGGTEPTAPMAGVPGMAPMRGPNGMGG